MRADKIWFDECREIEEEVWKQMGVKNHSTAGNSSAVCTAAMIEEARVKLDEISREAANQMAAFGSCVTRIVVDQYLAPPMLKWWEEILTWNPCNDFVNQEHVVYMLPNMTIVSPECYSILKKEFQA